LHLEVFPRPIDLEVKTELLAGLDGAFEVRSLAASGPGLSLAARGAGSLTPRAHLEATYEASADLARLEADPFSGGRLEIDGGITVDGDLARPRGTARFEARDVPGGDVESLVPFEPPPALRLAGTDVDAAGDLEVDLSATPVLAEIRADAIRADVSLSLSRESARLVEAHVRSDPEAGSGRCSVRASLFPQAGGSRRLEGSARIGALGDPSTIEILSARVHVVEPEVDAAVARLGYRVAWPGGTAPTGPLEATLEAAGPLLAPRLVLDAEVEDGGERLVVVHAHTLPGQHAWTSGLPLAIEASVLPEQPGTREIEARLAGADIRDGVVTIDVPDLGPAVTDLARRAGIALPMEAPRLETMLAGPFRATAGLEGPVTGPRVALDAAWAPDAGGSIHVTGAGRVSAASPYLVLARDATLVAENVDGAPLGLPGTRVHRLEATTDGTTVEVGTLTATIPPVDPGAAGGDLTARGDFVLAWPPTRGEVEVTVEHPLGGVDRVLAHARLVGGAIEVERLEVASGSSVATLTGSAPLAAVAPYAGALRETLASYPPGPVVVEAEGIDLRVLHAILLRGSERPVPSGTLRGRISLDAEHPALSSGSLEVAAFSLGLEDHRLEAADTIRVELHEGKAALAPAELRAAGPDVPEGQTATISGAVSLAPGWLPERGFAALVENVSAELRGRLDAAWLTRAAGEGRGSGAVAIDATVSGPIGGLTGEIRASGPDAKLSFYSPYPTRVEGFDAHAVLRDGAIEIDTMKARWNGGTLNVHGNVGGEGSRLEAEFEGVTYRLDYGATARIGGKLALAWPAEGERMLSGTLNVERASVRRDIPLNTEMLRSLFEPEGVADDALLDTIHLDVDVTTDQGVRIKNNLADLSADWEPLHVGGTLAAPLVTGQAHVAAGGLLNLLGNIVRIDEGTLSWAGDPPSSPRLALRTTTSVEDPTIKNEWYRSWYQAPVQGPGEGGTMDLNADRAGSADVVNAFAAGVMTYYQDRIASAMSVGATQTEVSYQPLTLFGETDTTARMTITQRLSRWATFLASSDPTDPEAQTYILDLHGFDVAPSLSAQVFTNDEKNEGGTLQQTLRLGRGREETETGTRLRRIRIDVPKGVSKGKLRRAISYRPGDVLEDGAELDAEIDVVDALHQRGYPLAEATARLGPHTKGRADLVVEVRPGPRIETEFEGDRPRGPARRAIAALYRVGDEEAESLEAIRAETERSLQARGFLDPEVTVGVEGSTVRVHATGGRKVDPHTPRFEGVLPEEAERLAALFPTRLARISLASASPSADQRVTRALAAQGYPAARVASRQLSEDGKDLVVLVEPGGRQHFSGVFVSGLSASDEARITPLVEVRAGDPIEADAIARAIVAIETEMRRAGHAQVSVTAQLAPASPERPLERGLELAVTAGPVFEVRDVRFEGASTSKSEWLEKIADLPEGRPLDPHDLSKARARLARTGIFQRIGVTTDPPTDPSAGSAAGGEASQPVPTYVDFDLTERKRWLLAYGGRYETSKGFGFVTDLYNFNTFGRGHTTGFRGLFSEDEKRAQVYHSIPRVIGERSSLDGFVEWKSELDEGVLTEGTLAWLQLTFPPFGRWQTRTYVQVEDRNLTEENPDPANPIDERVASPALGWQLVYDSRVLPSVTTPRGRGFFYGINLVGTAEDLGSDFTGLGTFQQWSHFLPLGDPKRGRLGWNHSYRLNTTNAKDSPPPFDSLLRAGGEFSVRGYPTNSLGPLDENGDSVGGELVVIANEELHVRFGAGVSALLFMDFGNVWPILHDFDWDLSSSAGIGLRWLSPVGPLRLDWAVPLDRRPGDPSSIWYFGFGNVF
jgi:outer membrane protein assembly factor BamA